MEIEENSINLSKDNLLDEEDNLIWSNLANAGKDFYKGVNVEGVIDYMAMDRKNEVLTLYIKNDDVRLKIVFWKTTKEHQLSMNPNCFDIIKLKNIILTKEENEYNKGSTSMVGSFNKNSNYEKIYDHLEFIKNGNLKKANTIKLEDAEKYVYRMINIKGRISKYKGGQTSTIKFAKLIQKNFEKDIIFWENDQDKLNKVDDGNYLILNLNVGLYKNELQLTVTKFTKFIKIMYNKSN